MKTVTNPCVGPAGECDQDLGEGHRGAEEGDQGEGHHRTQQGEREEGAHGSKTEIIVCY